MANEKDRAETSIDLIGIGRAMKAIPPEAWDRLVKTGCKTFEKIVAPVTEAFGGIGRLVEAKFDGLVDVQKVLVAEAVATAERKAKRSRRKAEPPRLQILLQVVEQAANETDPGIRELWANLLANEMTGEHVHPEIGRVLGRITTEDAQLLSAITRKRPNSMTEVFTATMKMIAEQLPIAAASPRTETSFNHAHLKNLNLIEKLDRVWILSTFGRGFIAAVSDPALESKP